MVQTRQNRLTAFHILTYLRQRLIEAIGQNDKDELQYLVKVFDMLWNIADENKVQGSIVRVLENLQNTASDHFSGVGVKSILPSEEDIKAALGIENLPL